MSYPIFSQPTGPRVLISLFGDAAQAGAKLGAEVPTQLTSAIQGAEQGYQYALQTTGEAQQNTIRDNQIQQIPTANRIQNAQATIEESQAKIAEQTAARDTANAAAQTQSQAAQLTLQANQATQANDLVTQQTAFMKNFQQATPSDQADMYFSGSNASLFAQNPSLRKGILEQLSFNPSLDSNQLAQVNRDLGHAKIDDYYSKQAQENIPKLIAAREAAFNGEGQALTDLVSNKLKVPRENAVDAVELVPSGTFKINPDTGKVMLDANGQRITTSALEMGAAPKNLYDAISTRPDSLGTVVTQGVSQKTHDAYNSLITQRGLQQGLQAEYAKRYAAGSQTQGQTAPPGTGPNPLAAGSGSNDPFVTHIQTSLGLPPDVLKPAVTPILSLKSELTSYVRRPLTRTDPAVIKGISNTVNTITRTITDHQYDNSPAIQAQYKQSDVDNYNMALSKTLDSSLFSQLPPSARESFGALLQAFKVETPKDLYAVNHGGPINTKLHQLVTDTMADAQARSTSAAQRAGAIQSTNSYFGSVANGGPTG